MIERYGVQIPELADLPAKPRGIVLHWTGGGPTANPVDLAAYHAVVEQDAAVKLGRWPIAANMRTLSGSNYAAHTGGWNSFRVGLSAAGMKDYTGPGTVGPHPLTAFQVVRLAALAGFCCRLWGLDPADPHHLCTHREVWTLHGIKGQRNHEKRDIEHLPFLPTMAPDEVGPYLRRLATVPDVPAIEIPDFPMPEVPREVIPPAVLPTPEREAIMQTVQAKPWWQSKTILLGAVQIAVGAAELVSTTPILEGSEIAGIAATVAGALTIALRFLTKKPVAASEKPVTVS